MRIVRFLCKLWHRLTGVKHNDGNVTAALLVTVGAAKAANEEAAAAKRSVTTAATATSVAKAVVAARARQELTARAMLLASANKSARSGSNFSFTQLVDSTHAANKFGLERPQNDTLKWKVNCTDMINEVGEASFGSLQATVVEAAAVAATRVKKERGDSQPAT
eukprot:gnl/MRDRNA2_/MRDRNA2_39301_c0_seq1.p1 gnl/MRDRNA2_/MRDRNA2_39301_c0~~gnl/MRDRNA2_/MRDRNA2_39301_c0_seq1.p1  ORF type:complete len:164 (+),score=46.12 gnl/MRDRNA2_/MRDRNA2_39301_c0_seq1:154-645(+)